MEIMTMYRCKSCHQITENPEEHMSWDCGPMEKYIGVLSNDAVIKTEWGLDGPNGTITPTVINLADAYLAHDVYTRIIVASEWMRLEDDI